MPAQTTGTANKLIQQAVKERESRRSGRSRTVAVLVLLALFVLGLVLILAVYPGHPDNTSAPQCNGATMSPSDICDEYVNGGLTNSYSYQDMLHQQQASHPLALVAGIIAIAIAVLVLAPVLRAFDPAKPWGTVRPENCPQCHQPNLREKPMTHTETRGRVQTTWRGIVTLCTPGCDFATVRQP
jgi:ABC-type Fe3+ transport system permease subunit